MAKPPVKAQELAHLLAEEVRNGKIATGEWLPAERQLAEQHQVSRSTAHQAVEMLVELGVAEEVPGRSGKRVRGDVAGVASDDLRRELGTIRQQLSEITERLTAIEAHTGAAKSEK